MIIQQDGISQTRRRLDASVELIREDVRLTWAKHPNVFFESYRLPA
jgi:hypothetical protein